MTEIYLKVSIIKKCLCVTSNDEDILMRLRKYYNYYLSEKKEDIYDELILIINEDDRFILNVSYHKENPKYYSFMDVLKGLINIIDEYIETEILQSKMNDIIIMHGSCIMLNEIPIILIGKSKSGKSTAILKMLHYFFNSKFITDDFLVIDTNKRKVIPISMPLHIRNGILETEKLDNTQYFAINKLPYYSVREEYKTISSIFSIQFSKKNFIKELSGLEKVTTILSNIKYYNKTMISNSSIFEDIRIFQLDYCDDNFLVDNIKNILSLQTNINLFNVLSRYIKNRHLENNKPFVVIQGDSMFPTLKHNQRVFIQWIETADIKKGDIVLYKKFKHLTVHRVVNIENKNNILWFQTKGDNNQEIDNYKVYPYEIIGKVVVDI